MQQDGSLMELQRQNAIDRNELLVRITEACVTCFILRDGMALDDFCPLPKYLQGLGSCIS